MGPVAGLMDRNDFHNSLVLTEGYKKDFFLNKCLWVHFFFFSGLLDRNDFHNSLNWSVLILIGGGLALGHVMERSCLRGKQN